MSWEYIKAEDFCDSVRDGTHDTPKPTMSGHKLVTSKHIKNGQIDPTEAYCISEEDYQVINARSLVEQWDVLMSMIGTVGESAVVKQIPDYAIKNVALFKCGKSEIRGKWLNYYLQSPDARARMLGNMKGSSQQFLSLKQLRALPIPVCDNETMEKIVDILSTYDDLIENNRKQIKLLEEAAQRLYKEWFVDLRFPGHEHTKIVDGVPEGWRVTTLDEICSVRKEMLTPEKIDVDTPYIGLEHIPRKDICLSEWGSFSEISSNKFRYYEDDILFGKIRPYFHKVGFALNNGVTSTDAIVLKSTEGLWSFLLMTASSSEFVSYTYQNCKEGAKMPRADWKQMKSYPTIIADRAIQSAFEDQIYTITRTTLIISKKPGNTGKSRDRDTEFTTKLLLLEKASTRLLLPVKCLPPGRHIRLKLNTTPQKRRSLIPCGRKGRRFFCAQNQKGGDAMYFTSGSDRAFESLMQGKPGFDHYDSGDAGAPEDCGDCRF